MYSFNYVGRILHRKNCIAIMTTINQTMHVHMHTHSNFLRSYCSAYSMTNNSE